LEAIGERPNPAAPQHERQGGRGLGIGVDGGEDRVELGTAGRYDQVDERGAGEAGRWVPALRGAHDHCGQRGQCRRGPVPARSVGRAAGGIDG
jgi:hypothetical protein